MQAIRDGLFEILREQHPMSVRGVFYQASNRKLVAKTEAECKGTVTRLLRLMRREKRVPYSWLTDATRWMHKSPSSGSLAEALEETHRFYRQVRVEIWCEKEALAGVLMTETNQWDVPLMVCRGYSSLTYLHSAAESIVDAGKPVFIYHFGDYDPSGQDIPRVIERDIRQLVHDLEPDFNQPIHFERIAVLPEQIEDWQLPTRPTKKTDSRSKGFEDESVELDAIPEPAPRTLVRDCITRHIDEQRLRQAQLIEEQERTTLHYMVGDFLGGAV